MNAHDHRQRASALARTQRVLAVAALVAIAATAVAVTFGTPDEETMGSRIRLLYVHAGAAWTAYVAYGLTALGAVLYLFRRQSKWDRLAVAAAEMGVLLTTLTLVTGSLWGRSVNGWWWDWGDLRLVLTLFLWFLYVAYLILRSFTEGEQRATLSAVLALAGLPTMVLNHFAVRLYQRAHPPQIIMREGAPAVDSPYLLALALSVLAYTLVLAALIAQRMRLEATRDQAVAARVDAQ